MKHTGALIQRLLKIDQYTRSSVYAQVYASADFTSLEYWLGISFSAGIATLGLVENSPAVIIGAMLISPLMNPIMAVGLGLAIGDVYLSIKAIANLVISIALAIGLSAGIVWVLPFHASTNEILSRTNPTLLDLGIALFSGLAGSVIVGRGNSGSGATTIPGVAIAVALMPPLGVMGFGLGSGVDTAIIGGAGLLFLTNLVAIIASAFFVFFLVGMNSMELAVQMEECRKGEWLIRKLGRDHFSKMLAHGGQLRWRMLILLVALGSIFVPLHRALLHVTEDALARSAVESSLKGLLPPGALVSRQVEVGKNSIAIRLFSTKPVSAEKIASVERTIEARSGRKTEVFVVTVASQTELAQMMEKLSAVPAPVAAPPPVPTIEDIHQQLLSRVTPVLTQVWPVDAHLVGFDVSMASNGITVDVQYQSKKELSPIELQTVSKALQDKLNAPTLMLNAEHIVPRPTPVPRVESHKLTSIR